MDVDNPSKKYLSKEINLTKFKEVLTIISKH